LVESKDTFGDWELAIDSRSESSKSGEAFARGGVASETAVALLGHTIHHVSPSISTSKNRRARETRETPWRRWQEQRSTSAGGVASEVSGFALLSLVEDAIIAS